MAEKRRFPIGDKEMDGVEVAFDPNKRALVRV